MTKPENSQATRSSLRLPAWAVSILRGALIALALGMLFAWLGVYGTGAIPMFARWVYWSGLMAIGIVSAAVVNPLVFDRWMRASHPALQIAVVALLISAPITAGLILLEFAADGSIGGPQGWWTQYVYVVVISALLTTGGWAADRLVKPAGPAAPAPAGPAAGQTAGLAFADRLPARFRAAEIHAVSAEDHYLRVHTSAGETLILMRLADAVRELAALEGMQTHRSWWVARHGLAGTVRTDGKVTLKLKSGAEAPVSRTYLKAVRDAGWL